MMSDEDILELPPLVPSVPLTFKSKKHSSVRNKLVEKAQEI